MTTTTQLVRSTLGALGDAAVFDDSYILTIIDEAEAFNDDVDCSTTLGARLHRLETARMLAVDYLGRIQNGAVQRIKEGDTDIDLGDLRTRVQAWDTDIERIRRKLTTKPPGFGWVGGE